MRSTETAMSSTEPRRRGLSLALRGAAALLTLAAVLGLGLAPAAGSAAGAQAVPGRWVPTGSDGCPAGLVCAKWELTGGEQAAQELLCCIPAGAVWSSNFGACAGFRE